MGALCSFLLLCELILFSLLCGWMRRAAGGREGSFVSSFCTRLHLVLAWIMRGKNLWPPTFPPDACINELIQPLWWNFFRCIHPITFCSISRSKIVPLQKLLQCCTAPCWWLWVTHCLDVWFDSFCYKLFRLIISKDTFISSMWAFFHNSNAVYYFPLRSR